MAGGADSQAYTLNIRRLTAEEDARLASLSLTPGSLLFHPHARTHTAQVSSSNKTVTVAAAAAQTGDGRVFDYSVRVPLHTTMTTITASSAASGGASAVAFDVADADSAADGHQVSIGPNDPVTVIVTVTAPDGISTSTYTVTIRAAPVWRATMTVAEAVNVNGYNSRTGLLTSASFDFGAATYTLTEILAWEFMYITVDNALPTGFVLEVNGEQ